MKDFWSEPTLDYLAPREYTGGNALKNESANFANRIAQRIFQNAIQAKTSDAPGIFTGG
jgi:hypothetical protein